MKKLILILAFLFLSVPFSFAQKKKKKPHTDIWNYPEQFQTLIDYDDRTDDNAVYIGRSSKGSAASADNWVIYQLTYDEDDRLVVVQVATGSWDNRASLTYE